MELASRIELGYQQREHGQREGGTPVEPSGPLNLSSCRVLGSAVGMETWLSCCPQRLSKGSFPAPPSQSFQVRARGGWVSSSWQYLKRVY